MSVTEQKYWKSRLNENTLRKHDNILQRTIKKVKLYLSPQVQKVGNDYKDWIMSFRGSFIVFVFLALALLIFGINNGQYYNIFILAMIYSIFAASWDLLSGVTGQISFGHAAFFGIGAYAFAILVNLNVNANIILIMLISASLTVIIGLIIAIPSLRLRGPYLALGTLAFSLILFYMFQQPRYIHMFPPFELDNIELPLAIKITYRGNQQLLLFIVMIVMIISIAILLIIYNSNLGKIFKGIRDDENAIKASGINTWKYKLFAFMISAFFAGLAGCLYSLNNGQSTFSEFSTSLSFFPVIFACLGGIAQISGAVMGAFTFIFVRQLIEEILPVILRLLPFIDSSALILYIDVISLLIFAIILIVIIRFTERGIMEPIIKNSKIVWDLVSGK